MGNLRERRRKLGVTPGQLVGERRDFERAPLFRLLHGALESKQRLLQRDGDLRVAGTRRSVPGLQRGEPGFGRGRRVTEIRAGTGALDSRHDRASEFGLERRATGNVTVRARVQRRQGDVDRGRGGDDHDRGVTAFIAHSWFTEKMG